MIESTYPVSTKRKDRAIAGFSMGGVQTMNLALWRSKIFSYVFALSTGVFSRSQKELEQNNKNIIQNDKINEFRLFKIYMGDESDFAYQNNLNTMALFDKYGINYTYENGEGGHTFLAWRRNLFNLVPLLFRKNDN